jgi:hypothetical protein
MSQSRIHVMVAIAAVLVAGVARAEIEIHEEHSFDARAGATVVVDASFHDVEVTARAGTTVDVVVDLEVKGTGSSARKIANALRPEFLDEGDRLIIRSTRKSGWSWRGNPARGTITVEMPPGVDLLVDVSSGGTTLRGDFGDAEVAFEASSGGLEIDGVMRELRADVSSGSIRVNVHQPLARFRADASSGNIRLTGGADSAKIDTSSGSIHAKGLRGSAKLGSSSGSITASWDVAGAGDEVTAHASSGSVRLSFPPKTIFRGVIDVGSGGLHSDFPALVRDKDAIHFDGGEEAVGLRVSTSSGSVRLISN